MPRERYLSLSKFNQLFNKLVCNKFFSRTVAICLIAVQRIRMMTMKHVHSQFDLTQSQLDQTHYSLPRKMPWIKC